MKNFFVFEKKGREGFELKVSAGNLSDHQLRLVVTSIGDEAYRKANGCWPESEMAATAWGIATLIKAAGYIHYPEEVEEEAKNLQQMLQEKWEEHLEKCSD